MNIDARLSTIVDVILRFELRLARLARPVARALDRPPTTAVEGRGQETGAYGPAVVPRAAA